MLELGKDSRDVSQQCHQPPLPWRGLPKCSLPLASLLCVHLRGALWLALGLPNALAVTFFACGIPMKAIAASGPLSPACQIMLSISCVCPPRFPWPANVICQPHVALCRWSLPSCVCSPPSLLPSLPACLPSLPPSLPAPLPTCSPPCLPTPLPPFSACSTT